MKNLIKSICDLGYIEMEAIKLQDARGIAATLYPAAQAGGTNPALFGFRPGSDRSQDYRVLGRQ